MDERSPGRAQSRRNFLRRATAGLAGLAAAGTAQASETATIAPSPGRLAGKVAVITGAARGIGRAIAEAFAKEGADVMGIDICREVSPAVTAWPASEADLDETARLVRGHGRRFVPVVADVRRLPALRDAARRATQALGHVDILVANAGIQTFAPLLTMGDQQWQDVLDVNLTGYANSIRAFAPLMVPRRRGRIILIASGQGRHGVKNAASYSVSKWGVIGLTKCAALELGEHNITVNAIEPGLTDTALTRNPTRWKAAIAEAERLKYPPEDPAEARVTAGLAHKTPLQIPWLKPEDIAPVAVFLASEEARYVTGSTYDVNAGDSANYSA